MNFENLIDLIRKKLGSQVELEGPYKLCDYKPMYGIIFEELLESYDFWGYCDCDLVFGKIRKFITDEILSNNDVVQMLGHMTFFRNNDVVNNIFKLKSDHIDYKKIIQIPIVVGFDEFGMPALMKQNNMRIYINNKIIADVLPFKERFLIENGDNSYPQVFTYENGEVFRYYYKNGKITKNEMMYIHLQKRKMDFDEKRILNSKEFIFVPDKIVRKKVNLFEYSNLIILDKKNIFKRIILLLVRIIKSTKKIIYLIKIGKLLEFVLFRKESKKIIRRIY
jgi:hypothetical protein